MRPSSMQPLLQTLRVLFVASRRLSELSTLLSVRQLTSRASSSAQQRPAQRRTSLGELCREFKEHAKKNNAIQTERLHEAYLEAGGKPQLWMFNSLIGMYARRREPARAFAVYEKLLRDPQGLDPNEFTYGNLLNALAKSEHPPYDLAPEVVDKAEAVFAEMLRRGVRPNQVAFHTLMDVHAKAAQPDAAFRTYRDMLAAGLRPDVTTFSRLMTACGRAGDHRRAAEVMEKLMPQAGVSPTTAIWNSMLGAYAKSGSVDGAYATWLRMLESGAAPDSYTERALVDALSSHPALAADVVAEARAIRQRLAAQQAQQEAQRRGGAGAAGTAAEEGAGEGLGWAGAGGGAKGGLPVTGSGPESSRGGGSYSRPTVLRQGELPVDQFTSSATTPMAGTAYGREVYRSGGGSSSSSGLPRAGLAGQLASSGAAAASAPAAGAGGEASPAFLGDGARRPDGTLSLRSLLWLDLHGMSQAAARASLLRRLELLVNLAQELVAQVAEEQDAAAQRAQQAQQQQEQEQGLEAQGVGAVAEAEAEAKMEAESPTSPSQQGQHAQQRPWQPQRWRPPGASVGGAGAGSSLRERQRHALVIVTGVGRNSKVAGSGVLREAVTQLLQQHGIPWRDDPTNAGRVLVPWPGLRDFVQAQREAMQTDHFFGAARARYTYIAAGVAGLMAAAFLVPRLAPWMPPN